MINVLIPLGASSPFFDGAQYPFPSPLIEVAGRPMIELAIENLRRLDEEVQFIFVLRNEQCRRFHLDKTLSLIADGCRIVRLDNETKGSACSCLMAIDCINEDAPLVIANADQVIDVDVTDLISKFQHSGADAGCLYFNSVLPRWSYVRIEGDCVVETAEKMPISKCAIAGFYYFRCGDLFVQAAMRSIMHNAQVGGSFYVAPVLNELILDGRRVVGFPIPNDAYHTFYMPQKIEEYERRATVVPSR